MEIKRSQQSAFHAAKWMTGASYVIFVTGFINSVFITRSLGPTSYGVYSYLIWMISVAVVLTTGGLNLTAIRFIAEAMGQKNIAQANAIYGWLRRLMWMGLVLMVVALLSTALAPGMFPMEVASRLYLHLGFVLLCSIARTIYLFSVSASKGYSVFHTEAITAGGLGVINTVASGILYLTHQDLNAYLLLFVVTSIIHPILATVLIHRSGIQAQPHELPDETRTKLRSAVRWNTSMALVGMLSSKSIDTYLMGLQSLTVYIGYYNIASSLAKSGLDLLTTGFSSMLLPFISRAEAEGGRAKVQEIFAASVRFYQFMGILVAAGGYLMAELIVHTLYGRAYNEVIPALQVMAVVGGLTIPIASYNAIFIATDSHKARLRFIFVGAGISSAAAFVFIPWLGFRGALLSNIVGNTLTFLITAVVAHRSLGIRFPVRNIAWQGVVAAASLGFVLLVLHDPSSIVRSLAATMAFGVLFLLGTINTAAWERSDLDMLRKNSSLIGRVLDVVQIRR